LIDQGYWGLDLPLVVRDQEISIATLGAMPPRCYDGPHPGSRALSLQSPMLRGGDVRLMQLGLSIAGIDIKADGIFGRTSARCLKAYQSASNLSVTGAAEPGLVAQLADM
jgi:chitosanase